LKRRRSPRVERRRPPCVAVLCASFGALATLCAACPGSLDDPGRFLDGASGCPDVPTAIFAVRCTDSGCHTARDKAQNLDLQSPDVAARLLGVPATGGAGLLVDPMSPEQSVLYAKLSPSPPYGARMPSGKEPLDDADIACILRWIAAGADAATASGEDSGADASAEVPETGVAEAGVPDGSRPDASEAGAPDAAPRDAAPRDASRPDASLPDAAPRDAAPRDAIADAAPTG
jgi:hypothetical protein